MATENQHRPNDFTPVVGAMNLAEYVLQITGNMKYFPDCSVQEKKKEDGSLTQVIVFRDDPLTNTVRREAMQIYHLTFSANEINVKKQPWRKQERLDSQIKAMAMCTLLLADIQLCRKHFHLSTKRIEYWGRKVRDLRKAIEGWHEKDKDRYKDI